MKVKFRSNSQKYHFTSTKHLKTPNAKIISKLLNFVHKALIISKNKCFGHATKTTYKSEKVHLQLFLGLLLTIQAFRLVKDDNLSVLRPLFIYLIGSFQHIFQNFFQIPFPKLSSLQHLTYKLMIFNMKSKRSENHFLLLKDLLKEIYEVYFSNFIGRAVLTLFCKDFVLRSWKLEW